MAYQPIPPLGQTTKSASLPVTIASDQGALDSNLTKVGGTAFALGQQLAATALPVVLTAAQITTLTPPAALTNFALETGGNLATLAGIVSAARAAVNPIFGQVGVQGASGVVTALTQRMVLATDVALPTGTNSIGQVTANAGSNLNTSALALSATQTDKSQFTKITDGTDTWLISAAGSGQVALDAETTKVIGVVRNADGSGNLLTSTSNALDINLKTSSITLPISGTVSLSGTGSTGTSALEVQGALAHDAGGGSLNPVAQGGYASAAAPSDVSADNDIVRSWHLRNGAQAMVLTAAGALIAGDAANGLDVDVTRMSALVAGSALIGKVGIDQTTPGTTNLVALSAETTKVIGTVNVAAAQTIAVTNIGTFAVQATLAAETTKVIGTVNQGTSPWVVSGTVTATASGTQDVDGTLAQDAAAAAVKPILIGGFASAAAPTSVSADGDAVQAWYLRNGAAATVLTAAGALIGGDAANGIDVDVTRLSALVAGSALIGKVGLDQTTPGTTNAISIAQLGANTVSTGNGVSGTGVLRVSVASDSTGQIALAAGSATIGALTANQTVNVAQWNGVAPAAAAALADGLSTTPTVPQVGSVMLGKKSDGTNVLDRAGLAKLFDLDTGANTENVLGASLRTNAGGGSTNIGAVDNATNTATAGGFIDGTSGVMPAGYIFDETAGTALTENDVGAARIDAKRAQVMVIEDGTTRSRKATVAATGELSVFSPEVLGTALTPYSVRLTTNTTTTPISATAYIHSIAISAEVAGTTSTLTIQDKQGTPLKLVNALTTVAVTTGPVIYNFQKPVKMTSGIDIITAGVVAATLDIWIGYSS